MLDRQGAGTRLWWQTRLVSSLLELDLGAEGGRLASTASLGRIS